MEDVKKLCSSLRRNAKGDRLLFHYNGHGVPRPTASGEVWVFNKTYTQYIPLSIYDLRSWVGNPSIYVLDCSGAGVLLPHFLQVCRGMLFQRKSGKGQGQQTGKAGGGARGRRRGLVSIHAAIMG
jgi:regulator-associated protein of mTOR